MIPSPEEIEAAKTANGGWTREQLAEWGLPWPPPPLWRRVFRSAYLHAPGSEKRPVLVWSLYEDDTEYCEAICPASIAEEVVGRVRVFRAGQNEGLLVVVRELAGER